MSCFRVCVELNLTNKTRAARRHFERPCTPTAAPVDTHLESKPSARRSGHVRCRESLPAGLPAVARCLRELRRRRRCRRCLQVFPCGLAPDVAVVVMANYLTSTRKGATHTMRLGGNISHFRAARGILFVVGSRRSCVCGRGGGKVKNTARSCICTRTFGQKMLFMRGKHRREPRACYRRCTPLVTIRWGRGREGGGGGAHTAHGSYTTMGHACLGVFAGHTSRLNHVPTAARGAYIQQRECVIFRYFFMSVVIHLATVRNVPKMKCAPHVLPPWVSPPQPNKT